MVAITIRAVRRGNWREALRLGVHPEQQRFVADSVPIAAIVLAKAYVGAGELTWRPYAVYAEGRMVGLLALAYARGDGGRYWLYHFFIDRAEQGRGYGTRALRRVIAFVAQRYPRCRTLCLTVHPENTRARRLYVRLGFEPTGEQRDGEPVYARTIRERDNPGRDGENPGTVVPGYMSRLDTGGSGEGRNRGR